MWHALAAWLILFPAGIQIILTVSVPVFTQAFSWSFLSQEAVWQQIGFFTLGFTPARLTPLTQDNSSRQVLRPCLPSRVPVPCWGTHNSHHCQDPMLLICGPILSIFRILQTEKWMTNNDCTFYLVVIWGANKLQSELYKLWRWWLTRGEGPSPEQCLRVLVLTSAVG